MTHDLYYNMYYFINGQVSHGEGVRVKIMRLHVVVNLQSPLRPLVPNPIGPGLRCVSTYPSVGSFLGRRVP